jgi:hypothetical protein
MAALVTSALALSASGEAQAQAKTDAVTVSTDAGSILCSGDLCIQTVAVDTAEGLAEVNAWADTTTFTGHFEITVPKTWSGENSTGGDKKWPAGGTHYSFVVPLFPGLTYQATAWRRNSPGHYSDIGRVNFGIDDVGQVQEFSPRVTRHTGSRRPRSPGPGSPSAGRPWAPGRHAARAALPGQAGAQGTQAL